MCTLCSLVVCIIYLYFVSIHQHTSYFEAPYSNQFVFLPMEFLASSVVDDDTFTHFPSFMALNAHMCATQLLQRCDRAENALA